MEAKRKRMREKTGYIDGCVNIGRERENKRAGGGEWKVEMGKRCRDSVRKSVGRRRG